MEDILQVLLAGGTPEQLQQAQAEALRGRQTMQSALKSGQQQASKYDLLNFVAQAAGNNPGLAQGVGALQKTQAARYKPQTLGKSVLIGDQMVDEPSYAEDQRADRQQRLMQAASALIGKRETTEQRAEQAKEAERGRNERHAENLETRRLLAGAIAANRGVGRADKLEADRERRLNVNTQKYSAALNKEGIPDLDDALQTALTTLSAYPEGKLPGFGRIEGSIPQTLSTDEMQIVRSDLQKAANILIKSRAGTAVSGNEEQRVILRELAMGKTVSEKALRHAFSTAAKNFDAKVSSVSAGYSPETHDEFVNRGGMDYRGYSVKPRKAVPPSASSPDDALINKWLK